MCKILKYSGHLRFAFEYSLVKKKCGVEGMMKNYSTELMSDRQSIGSCCTLCVYLEFLMMKY